MGGCGFVASTRLSVLHQRFSHNLRRPLSSLGAKPMSKTKTFLDWWQELVAVLGLLLLLTPVLAGCGADPTAAPTEPSEPTEISVEPATATLVPTEPPTPTAAPTQPPPTATPTEEPTPEPVDDTACISCHTDEEALQAVAVEEEKPEVESEGEG
jgi:outer membrane biosynthesis protein TonB